MIRTMLASRHTGWINGILGIPDQLYDLDDMRESEIARLDELVLAAMTPVVDEARRRATEALVGALVRFAAEHPEAPLAARQEARA